MQSTSIYIPAPVRDIQHFYADLLSANKYAKMHVYGGEFTSYMLAESSAHPYDAGVAPELLKVLK